MNRFVLWGLAAFAIAGCGSSPPSTFYALAPVQARVDGQASPQAGPRTIRVRRPSIPGYLDRPQIVRRVVDYRLGVASNDRWGGPLDEMMGRVLAQDIELRLPGSSAYNEDGAITSEPDATVSVNVQRFEIGADGDLLLAAEVEVEGSGDHAASATRSVRLVARTADGTAAGVVGGMSDLLGRLAGEIAGMLRDEARVTAQP